MVSSQGRSCWGGLVPSLGVVWDASGQGMPLGPGMKTLSSFPTVTQMTSLWDAWPCMGWAWHLGEVLGYPSAPRYPVLLQIPDVRPTVRRGRAGAHPKLAGPGTRH